MSQKESLKPRFLFKSLDEIVNYQTEFMNRRRKGKGKHKKTHDMEHSAGEYVEVTENVGVLYLESNRAGLSAYAVKELPNGKFVCWMISCDKTPKLTRKLLENKDELPESVEDAHFNKWDLFDFEKEEVVLNMADKDIMRFCQKNFDVIPGSDLRYDNLNFISVGNGLYATLSINCGDAIGMLWTKEDARAFERIMIRLARNINHDYEIPGGRSKQRPAYQRFEEYRAELRELEKVMDDDLWEEFVEIVDKHKDPAEKSLNSFIARDGLEDFS